MDNETRARLAKGLRNNKLLPVLFDERADEITELWRDSKPDDAEARERYYLELRTLSELRDFLNAKFSEYGGGAGTE